jgi:hypothetical protein
VGEVAARSFLRAVDKTSALPARGVISPFSPPYVLLCSSKNFQRIYVWVLGMEICSA